MSLASDHPELFDDALIESVASAIETQESRTWYTPEMREELYHYIRDVVANLYHGNEYERAIVLYIADTSEGLSAAILERFRTKL